MKRYDWEIKENTINEETEEEMEVIHRVSLRCSMLTGKAIVTIDGTEFDISVRPFSLRGTNQMFRLGEMPALLDFPKKGEPDIVIDNIRVRSGKPYNA
ncbi:MAG: hypothetical protein IKA76_08850 [Clostridia bacterium]|nr:hypothetical protein [Clostridia bacterium]